ncbi:MAG: hypothetical protein KC502_00400 [Myxococcales bacterium]|nr:hypothetical protein [Myxococcales bacterium]
MRIAARTLIISLALLTVSACSSDDGDPQTGAGKDAAVLQDGGEEADGTTANDASTNDTSEADAASSTDAITDAGSTTEDAGSSNTDAGEADTTTSDAGTADAGTDVEQDTAPIKVCNLGETKCIGAKLGTCGVFEDGWIESNCFAGTTCSQGKCVPVSNNLIIAFDTSGSMGASVSGCTASGQSWPSCDPTKKCTRMDVSKVVFTSALKKIDASATRMALFRFPQKTYKKSTGNCSQGFYQGASTISGEQSPGPSNQQAVTASSAWYWDTVFQTLSVRFPPNGTFQSKPKILKWMDGTEAIAGSGTCSNSSSLCKIVKGCPGSCCSNTCWKHTDPELRQTGGTPIGKTLFYIGEYLKNVVVIDGKSCKTTADCDNVNYTCKMDKPTDTTGKCKDVARTCRDTVVVLFTDGGQGNSNTFFAPWVQAKRLGHGLCCQSDKDCVGGTVDNPTVCKSGKCLPKSVITGYYCTADMKPCLTTSQKGDSTYCSKQCVKDPMPALTACATNMQNNVLRSPDGKPFGVKLNVVDISGATNLSGSMSISLAGNGQLLGIDASDPDVFLKTLTAVFDIKNKKICNESF